MVPVPFAFSSRDSVFFERLRPLRVWRAGNSCGHPICSVLASSSRRSEPGGQRVGEPPPGLVSHPGHVSVGPNQTSDGSRDRPDCRKLPRTHVCGVDQMNAIRPRTDVEAAGLTEVEEHRPGIVQQACGQKTGTSLSSIRLSSIRSRLLRDCSSRQQLAGICVQNMPRFDESGFALREDRTTGNDELIGGPVGR